MDNGKCKATLEGVGQCRAWALTDKDYCYAHDPEGEEARIESARRGGLVKQIRIEHALEAVDVNTPKDVVKLLTVTINEVREGKIPLQIANTIGFLTGHLLRAFEVAEMDKKLDEIRGVITERTPPKTPTRGRR